MLCLKCEAMRTWLKGKLSNGAPFPNYEEYNVAQHESGSALQNSYIEGCHLCASIWLSLNQEIRYHSLEPDERCLYDLCNIDIIFHLDPYDTRNFLLYAVDVSKEGKKLEASILLGPRARKY